MNELPSASGVAKQLRDSVLENELSRLLRDASDAEREDFLVTLLKSDRFDARMGALSLVRRTETSRESLRRILRVGLARGDVSEIKMWLRAVAPRMGINAILSFLINDEIEAGQVVRCWYHLMAYIRKSNVRNDARVCEKLRVLRSKVERNYDKLSEDERNNWSEFRNED